MPSPTSPPAASASPSGRRRRRWPRVLLGIVAVLLVAIVVALFWVRGQLYGSLAQLDGTVEPAVEAMDGFALSAPVTVERDALGVPTITAANRLDLAAATGFVHAQERFFQMDLLRRQAAGELSALFGPAALEVDKGARLHRFRARVERALAQRPAEEQALLAAYAAGVNAGLAALSARPVEYLLVRTEPKPWLPEDSLLVGLAMYFVLQDPQGRRESAAGLVHDQLPAEMAAFLLRRGTEWDAPLVGEPLPAPAIPGPEVFDLRSQGEPGAGEQAPEVSWALPPEREDPWDVAGLASPPQEGIGSNNFVIAGNRTASGVALVANDMHLPIGVPNTWYRARLVVAGGGSGGDALDVTGVTLPGIPLLVVGSNGHVAWGFTNSYGDWNDLVVLEQPAGDEEHYRTPDGLRAIERHSEAIELPGGASAPFVVAETIWGPIVDRDAQGRLRALRWVAHDEQAMNLGLMGLERAASLEQAFEVARHTGIPAQNLVVAAADGRIGWTIIGPVPRRFGTESGGELGFDGSRPESWAAGDRGWDGYLSPAEVPTVVAPEAGYLWTANARTLSGAGLALLGDGGYDLGARARQLRDDVAALGEAVTPADALTVQLDDRALLIARWRDLALAQLTPDAVAGNALRTEAHRILDQGWDGRASAESVAYRIARGFRNEVEQRVFEALTASLRAADEGFRWQSLPQREGTLWQLIEERPAHLLPPGHESWEALLLASLDTVLARIQNFGPLAEQTWGKLNQPRVRHPLSRAVPQLSSWLDIATPPLPGGTFMPRVQGTGFGASERLAVSPGREAEGYFHMPGGQSGHPLSPFYRAGHEAWVEGKATPFLPGETVHTLKLVPPGG
jgi:penicillin amidase